MRRGQSPPYNLTAYAEVGSEVLRQVKVNTVIVFGASLGGHVGYELVASIREINIKGLLVTGAPPSLGIAQLLESFNMDPDNNIAGNEVLTDEEVDMIIRYGCGTEKTPMLVEMVRRADGRARKFMTEGIKEGRGVDNRKVAAEMTVPLAGVHGAADPFIKLDIVDGLKYGDLCRGKCTRLQGLGHSPFWQGLDVFLPLFEDFIAECSAGE